MSAVPLVLYVLVLFSNKEIFNEMQICIFIPAFICFT